MLCLSLPTCWHGCYRIGLTSQVDQLKARRSTESIHNCVFACSSASGQSLSHRNSLCARPCLSESVGERRPHGRSKMNTAARAGPTQSDSSFLGPVQHRKAQSSLNWGFHAFGPLEPDTEPGPSLLLITGLVCQNSAAFILQALLTRYLQEILADPSPEAQRSMQGLTIQSWGPQLLRGLAAKRKVYAIDNPGR